MIKVKREYDGDKKTERVYFLGLMLFKRITEDGFIPE